MSIDLYLGAGWRAGIEITLDGDMRVEATVTRGTFLDALDNISDDISEWIVDRVHKWLSDAIDLDENFMTPDELKHITELMREARP